MDYREAQEEGKTFHCAWLLILIALIAWKEPKYCKFLIVDVDVCEEVRYDFLCYTKEPTQAMKIHIFFVLMQIDLHTVVNQYLRLPSSLYKQCCHIVEFKADFHRPYVKVMKDPTKTCHPFPYLVTKDNLLMAVHNWSK